MPVKPFQPESTLKQMRDEEASYPLPKKPAQKRMARACFVLAVLLLVFSVGMVAGLSFHAEISLLTQNVDLSDWISGSVITLLLLALGFNLFIRA